MEIAAEKKQLISKKTLDLVRKVEEKIAKTLVRFSKELNCSLTEELFIKIIGRENDYPSFSVNIKSNPVKVISLSELISLNSIESIVVDINSVEENIYRNLEKILIGFDKDTKLSQLEVWIYTKWESGKPLFYLYKDGKPHKAIKSYQII